MIVMKFGGTSTAGAAPIERITQIVGSKIEKKPIVVVSAMAGITNMLYKLATLASNKQKEEMSQTVSILRDKHIETAEQLLEKHPGLLLPATSRINEICDELETFASAICAIGELSDRSKAIIVSNGELLSSTIVGYALEAAGFSTTWLDARKFIITTGDYMEGEPDMKMIQELASAEINSAMETSKVIITQGFISSSKEGIPSVLGRGGSDYSASLIGMAVNAEAIEIWTDVDGVLTADPRMVPDAKCLEKLSFEEAAEMAHFGAKVLHPLTIEPAIAKKIPIYVLNSFKPENKGTLIVPGDDIKEGVKSVSFKENILVVNIFSTKMIEASGFLSKVFEIFGRNNVSVDLISTSEANISVTCEDNAKNIDNVVEELSKFAKVELDHNKAQISIIGKNLISQNGVASNIFAPLQHTKIYMITQGVSHINISIVVDKEVLAESVRSIHASLIK